MKYATLACALVVFSALSSASPILNQRSVTDRLVSNCDIPDASRFQAGSQWGYDELKVTSHETSFREALDSEMSKHHWFIKEHDWKNCDGNPGGGGVPGITEGSGNPGCEPSSSVPEPASMGLLSTALLGLGWLRSRRTGIRQFTEVR